MGTVRSAAGTSRGASVAAETEVPGADTVKGALPRRADRVNINEVDIGRSVERDR